MKNFIKHIALACLTLVGLSVVPAAAPAEAYYFEEPIYYEEPVYYEDPVYYNEPYYNPEPVYYNEPVYYEDPVYYDQPVYYTPEPVYYEEPSYYTPDTVYFDDPVYYYDDYVEYDQGYGYEYDYVDYGYANYIDHDEYMVYDQQTYSYPTYTTYSPAQYTYPTYTTYPSYQVSSSYTDNSYVDNSYSYVDNSYYSNHQVTYETPKYDYCDYNDCHKETKKRSVKTPSCDLKASDTRIEEGDSVSLSWEADDADEVKLKDDRGTVFFNAYVGGSDDGRYRVEPKRDTTYTLIVTNDDRKRDCEVAVRVEEDERVVVREVRTYEPTSGIYLKEAPYTGVDAKTTLTYMLFGLVTLWALYAAYRIAVRPKQAAAVHFRA